MWNLAGLALLIAITLGMLPTLSQFAKNEVEQVKHRWQADFMQNITDSVKKYAEANDAVFTGQKGELSLDDVINAKLIPASYVHSETKMSKNVSNIKINWIKQGDFPLQSLFIMVSFDLSGSQLTPEEQSKIVFYANGLAGRNKRLPSGDYANAEAVGIYRSWNYTSEDFPVIGEGDPSSKVYFLITQKNRNVAYHDVCLKNGEQMTVKNIVVEKLDAVSGGGGGGGGGANPSVPGSGGSSTSVHYDDNMGRAIESEVQLRSGLGGVGGDGGVDNRVIKTTNNYDALGNLISVTKTEIQVSETKGTNGTNGKSSGLVGVSGLETGIGAGGLYADGGSMSATGDMVLCDEVSVGGKGNGGTAVSKGKDGNAGGVHIIYQDWSAK